MAAALHMLLQHVCKVPEQRAPGTEWPWRGTASFWTAGLAQESGESCVGCW